MEQVLLDGMTYQFMTIEPVTQDIKDNIDWMRVSARHYFNECGDGIKNQIEKSVCAILDNNGYMQIDIAGYREIVPYQLYEPGKPKHGYIYLITDGLAVKIGQTKKPDTRFGDIQVGNPRKIIVLQIIEVDDMDRAEQSLHHWYQRFHIRGEWFNLLPLFGLDYSDYIERMLGADEVRHDYSYSVNYVNGDRCDEMARVWIRKPSEVVA